jgi:hypothetical protein
MDRPVRIVRQPNVRDRGNAPEQVSKRRAGIRESPNGITGGFYGKWVVNLSCRFPVLTSGFVFPFGSRNDS